jgi:beta-xylosidase
MHDMSRRQFLKVGVAAATFYIGRGTALQASSSQTFKYKNPIIDHYLADPCLIRAEQDYYLFATGKAKDGRFIQIYKSRDLSDWQFVRGAVRKGPVGSWNRQNFWAPEVIKLDGLYHLYYTASCDGTPKNTGNRVGLAVSKKIEGPYEDRGVVVPNASLDGHPFLDDDGALYLYYTIEHGNSLGLTAGQVYVDKLVAPDKVGGNAAQLISHHPWQEGPFILKRGAAYFLTYSTGAWTNETYCLRYAVGSSPLGPFVEQPDKILESNEQVKGPGHHSFFTGPDGRTWIAYHGWDPKFTARYPRMDPLVIEGGQLSSPGPTSSTQTIEIQS